MQRHVHLSFGWVKPLWTGRNTDGRIKMKELKGSSKTIEMVSYALEVSVNGVTYMCVCSPFQVIRHILKFVNWLNN